MISFPIFKEHLILSLGFAGIASKPATSAKAGTNLRAALDANDTTDFGNMVILLSADEGFIGLVDFWAERPAELLS